MGRAGRSRDTDRIWRLLTHLRPNGPEGEPDIYDDLYEFFDGGDNAKPMRLHEPWQDSPWIELIRPIVRLPLAWLSRYGTPNVEVRGAENIPRDGPVVFAPNHGSHADTLYFYMHSPGWVRHALGAAAARDVCFQGVPMGVGFRILFNVLAVARRGSRAASMVDEMARWLTSRRRRCLLIYPEGGRGFQNGRLGPFKKGVARIAMVSGAALVPVAIEGVNDVLPKGSTKIQRVKSKVRITFCEPLRAEECARPGASEYENLLRLIAELRYRLERQLGLIPPDTPSPLAEPEEDESGSAE